MAMQPTKKIRKRLEKRDKGLRRVAAMYQEGRDRVTALRAKEEALKPRREAWEDDDELQCTFHPVTNWPKGLPPAQPLSPSAKQMTHFSYPGPGTIEIDFTTEGE
jgi:hypothetical protein